MTQIEQLHRAIVIDPTDDLLRYAFADACEEAGEDDRAEFVRLQMRLWEASKGCRCGRQDMAHPRAGGQHTNGGCAVDRERVTLPDGRSKSAIHEQMAWRDLMVEGHFQWADDLTVRFVAPERGVIFAPYQFSWIKGYPYMTGARIIDWLDVGSSIVAELPIVNVRFLDRTPTILGRTFFWSLNPAPEGLDFAHMIPPGIYARLSANGFPSERDARNALSRAGIDFARDKHGLPPMSWPS